MEAVEFDFIVKDSLQALELYKKIFPVVTVEATNFEPGTNEVVFTIFDTRFHMLDENPEYQLFAPKPGNPSSFWFNVTVNSIDEVFQKAVDNGCVAIQEIHHLEAFGVSNASFVDPFGYMWMLHQIHEEVSFEDRMEIFKEDGFE